MLENVTKALTAIITEGKAKPELYEKYKQKLGKKELFCSGIELVELVAQQETLINCDPYLLWDAVTHFKSAKMVRENYLEESIAKPFIELIYKEVLKQNSSAGIAYLLLIIDGYADPTAEIIDNIFQQCSSELHANNLSNNDHYANLALGLMYSYGLKGGAIDIEYGQRYLAESMEAGNKLAAIFYYKQLTVAAIFANAEYEEIATPLEQLKLLAGQNILLACQELAVVLNLQNDQAKGYIL